jgi:hypothetical protein
VGQEWKHKNPGIEKMMRIPSDADQRSEVMAIAIPN